MHVLIQNLKISNFLSFFGKNEINLKPFTAIMAEYYEGKNDFFRCLEFIFGGNLNDLKVKTPLHLVHKALREEFLINSDIQSYVEITIYVVQNKKTMTFCKKINNCIDNVRIEHILSGVVTTRFHYEEQLTFLSLHIKRKNLLFYKEYFNNIIWGSSEDMEMTICNCLRELFVLEEWKKARKNVKFLTRLKNQTAEKNYNTIKKSYSIVTKCVERFKNMSFNGEDNGVFSKKTWESQIDSKDVRTSKEREYEVKEKILEIHDLEIKNEYLFNKMEDFKLKEAVLISRLYYEEIKLDTKPLNVSILQNRRAELKNEIREKEEYLSSIWDVVLEIKDEVQYLSDKITFQLVSLMEVRKKIFLYNRFTVYGRFSDYLQPSPYVEILKEILGEEMFYAHLCDTFEESLYYVNFLKILKYESREVFISFDNYSHKFRDIITASGEKGIEINNLKQLLIFLCKLNHFGFIDEVPIIIQKDFDYEDSLPSKFSIFLRNGSFMCKNGIISFKSDGDPFRLENADEILENLILLQKQEEMKYQMWNDLLHLKWEILLDISSLEKDLDYIGKKWQKSTLLSHTSHKFSSIPDIYTEYEYIFKQHTRERNELEKEIQRPDESLFSNGSAKDSISTGESLSYILTELEKVRNQKNQTRKELGETIQKLHSLYAGPFHGVNFQRHFPRFNNCNFDKTKLFFEIEFKKLKKLMAEDDFYEFKGSQEWRKQMIRSLLEDFNVIKKELLTSQEVLQTISAARKKILHPLMEHLNRHLTFTFHGLIDRVLPFINLKLSSEQEKLQLTTAIAEDGLNNIDIKHFNTFLKFIGGLSLFLQLAVYIKTPLMVFDDFEEYFPLPNDNLQAVLDCNILGKILPDDKNIRFHLLMRIGQYLAHFVKKNTPPNNIRNNGSTDWLSGPAQILCFTTGDFINAADHYVWIHSQTLPEEYITEDCNSYSKIAEFKFPNSDNLITLNRT